MKLNEMKSIKLVQGLWGDSIYSSSSLFLHIFRFFPFECLSPTLHLDSAIQLTLANRMLADMMKAEACKAPGHWNLLLTHRRCLKVVYIVACWLSKFIVI